MSSPLSGAQSGAPPSALSGTLSSPSSGEPEPPRRRGGGPRTPEGKARARLNALRHGLRAQGFALLPHEDAEAFRSLVAALRGALAPGDAAEALYVDAIAVALWRERRADRLEAEAMADIAPAEAGRSCGTDLTDAAARASLATVIRYRTAAQMEHRRALAMLTEHRRLRGAPARAGTAEAAAPARPSADARHDAARTNELAPPAPTPIEAPPPAPPPVDAPEPLRIEPREAERARLDPMDTPLLRALGRDPDLVLPVPDVEPRWWPKAQERAVAGPFPPGGPQPYRRVPGLAWHLWWDHQDLLDRPAVPDPADAGAEPPARAA